MAPTPPTIRTSKRKRAEVKYFDSDSSDNDVEVSLDDVSKDDVKHSNKVLTGTKSPLSNAAD